MLIIQDILCGYHTGIYGGYYARTNGVYHARNIVVTIQEYVVVILQGIQRLPYHTEYTVYHTRDTV